VAGIPRKRTAVVKTNRGPYKKITQIKGDSRWIPTALSAATTSPALASTPKSHRPLRYGGYDRRLKEFSFRITRDDGVNIDHTKLSYLEIYQPNIENPDYRRLVGTALGYPANGLQYWTYVGESWSYEKQEAAYVVKFKYNTRTQIWTVPFFSPLTPKAKRGIISWVEIYAESGIAVLYKRPASGDTKPRYIYKVSDWWKDEDKLAPKFYETVVPYFESSDTDDFVAITSPDGTYAAFLVDCDYDSPWPREIGEDEARGFARTAMKSMTITWEVKSSVPYDVIFKAFHAYARYTGLRMLHCCQTTVYNCLDHAKDGGGLFDYDDVSTITTSEGYSGGAETELDIKTKITPTPYTVEERIYSLTVTFGGPDPRREVQICTDGEARFDLAFLRFYSAASMDVDLNIE